MDSLWRWLGFLITDAALWDRLVEQKDEFFFRCCLKTLLRLRRKFSQLFHPRWRPDSSYFYQSPVHNGPIPAPDLDPICSVHDKRTLPEYTQQGGRRLHECSEQGEKRISQQISPVPAANSPCEIHLDSAKCHLKKANCSSGFGQRPDMVSHLQRPKPDSAKSDHLQMDDPSQLGLRPDTVLGPNSAKLSELGSKLNCFLEVLDGTARQTESDNSSVYYSLSESQDLLAGLENTQNSDKTDRTEKSDTSDTPGLDRAFLEVSSSGSDLQVSLARQLHFSRLESDTDFEMELQESIRKPDAKSDERPEEPCFPNLKEEDLKGPFIGPLNFGSYVPVLNPDDPRLQGTVINLSSRPLSNEQIETLGLGLQFRCAPMKVPYLQIIPGLELAARELARSSEEEAAAFHTAVIRELDKGKPLKPYLTKRQVQLLKDLKSNDSLRITNADKGGKVVILNATEYSEMCYVHLADPAYEKVERFGASKGKTVLINPKLVRKQKNF